MSDMNELTVIVLRKAAAARHVSNGEAFRLIRPLFESNGLEVGEPIDLADGFLFSIPVSYTHLSIDGVERAGIAGSRDFIEGTAVSVQADARDAFSGAFDTGRTGFDQPTRCV